MNPQIVNLVAMGASTGGGGVRVYAMPSTHCFRAFLLVKRGHPTHGKGDRSNLPERPEGCFAQIGPVPFSVREICPRCGMTHRVISRISR